MMQKFEAQIPTDKKLRLVYITSHQGQHLITVVKFGL
jgi:hypothetical protein